MAAVRSFRRRSVAVLGAAGALLAFLDVTIVTIALPSIDATFHVAVTHGSWVVNTFNIILTAAVLPAGRAADRWGHRPATLVGLAAFTVASAACALAPDLGGLIAARAIQALGAAALVPTSLALLQLTMRHRAVAVTVWGAVAAAAAGIGPSVGGALVTAPHGWRLAFAVAVPVGVATLALAVVAAPPHRVGREVAIPDLTATGVTAASIAALAAAIVQGPSWGWTAPAVIGLAALATAGGGYVAHRTAGHPAPLVAPDLLTRRVLTANTVSMVFSVAFAMALLNNVLFLVSVWRQTPRAAGLLMTCAPVVAALIAVPAGRLAERVGLLPMVAAGTLLFAGGCVWYAHLPPARHTLAWLAAGACTGAGTGTALPVAGSAAMAAVPDHRVATGGALNAAARQLGAVVGTSVLAAVIGTPSPGHAVQANRAGWDVAAGLALAAALIGLILGARRPRPVRPRSVRPRAGRARPLSWLHAVDGPWRSTWWRDALTEACSATARTPRCTQRGHHPR